MLETNLFLENFWGGNYRGWVFSAGHRRNIGSGGLSRKASKSESVINME